MEGDAGAGPLSLAEAAGSAPPAAVPDVSVASAASEPPVAASRLGQRWMSGICIVLALAAVGLTVGGYFALRYHRASELIARDNAAAVAAAKDCVVATQAPMSDDPIVAEQKIIDCATGEFRTQATLYSGVFVQAYRAAKVHVEVSEMRAAVERNNPDGSVDVLVAFRVKVDNVEAKGREFGYRLRAQLARDGDQYRIAKLDQVAK